MVQGGWEDGRTRGVLVKPCTGHPSPSAGRSAHRRLVEGKGVIHVLLEDCGVAGFEHLLGYTVFSSLSVGGSGRSVCLLSVRLSFCPSVSIVV